MPTQVQLNEWHKAFSRIERVDDYQKLNVLYKSICNRIETLKETIENHRPPRNPREDSIQCHEKVTHQMLVKQKGRVEKQMSELAKVIQLDIELSKEE